MFWKEQVRKKNDGLQPVILYRTLKVLLLKPEANFDTQIQTNTCLGTRKCRHGDAFRLLMTLKQLLTSADGDFQSILRRRDRAGPHLVIGTIGVISQVEIDEKTVAV